MHCTMYMFIALQYIRLEIERDWEAKIEMALQNWNDVTKQRKWFDVFDYCATD